MISCIGFIYKDLSHVGCHVRICSVVPFVYAVVCCEFCGYHSANSQELLLKIAGGTFHTRILLLFFLQIL